MPPAFHVCLLSGTFVRKPVLTLNVWIEALFSTTLLLGASKLTKFVVRADLQSKFLHHEFDVDGVIKQAESRDIIRYQIVRITEIHQRTQNTLRRC